MMEFAIIPIISFWKICIHLMLIKKIFWLEIFSEH